MSSAVEGTVYRARYRSSVIADPFDFPEVAARRCAQGLDAFLLCVGG